MTTDWRNRNHNGLPVLGIDLPGWALTRLRQRAAQAGISPTKLAKRMVFAALAEVSGYQCSRCREEVASDLAEMADRRSA